MCKEAFTFFLKCRNESWDKVGGVGNRCSPEAVTIVCLAIYCVYVCGCVFELLM